MTPNLAVQLAGLEKALAQAPPPEEIPVILGVLERVKATLWAKMLNARPDQDGLPEAPAKDRIIHSTAEVAKQLGFTVARVRDLCRQGKIRASRDGKKWLIRPGAVEQWLQQHQHKPTRLTPPSPTPSRGGSAPRLDAVPVNRR